MPDSSREDLETALDELFGDSETELERIEDLADGVAKSITTALRGAIVEGRTLNSLLADIGQTMADIALKQALKPVEGLLSGAIEGLFAASNPALGDQPLFNLGVADVAKTAELSGAASARAVNFATGSGAFERSPVNIHFTVNAQDAQSFRQSDAEISGLLLRSVRRGMRSN